MGRSIRRSFNENERDGYGHDGVVNLLIAKETTVPTSQTISKAPDLLLRAAKDRNETAVELFLKELDTNLKDFIGRTPLLWAAERGHEAIVKQLLATGNVDVNVEDKYGRTPLNSAITKGYESIVEVLLDFNGVRLNSHDKHGKTSLVHAVQSARDSMVKLLLVHEASPDFWDTSIRTPLWHAAHAGCMSIVELLLETPNVNPDHQDAHGFTPLLCAANRGHVDVVKLFIERGVKVKLPDVGRILHLFYASDIVKFLSQGKRVAGNFKNGLGLTLLFQAAERGYVTICEMLLDESITEYLEERSLVTVDSYTRDVMYLLCMDEPGDLTVSHAAERGQEAVVRLLLQRNASLEVDAEDHELEAPPS